MSKLLKITGLAGAALLAATPVLAQEASPEPAALDLLNPAAARRVGLDNYARAVADPLFRASFWHVLVYIAATLILSLVLFPFLTPLTLAQAAALGQGSGKCGDPPEHQHHGRAGRRRRSR